MKKDYQIIYLNGPSSVGKTPLARALQNSFQEPFLVFGLDQMTDMMPDKLNSWDVDKKVPGFSWEKEDDGSGMPLYKNWIGPFAHRLLHTLKKVVCTLVDDNYQVIIDDVSIGKAEVDEWRKALAQYRVLWVGLTAPLEILEDREKIRPDRRIGSARWQAEHVHEGVVYDLMLDTVANSLPECVSQIKGFMGKE
jgi:chloramphenicol 3-O phosphotransferase